MNEITRLRVALEKVKNVVGNSKWRVSDIREISDIVDKALSSHTEDTEWQGVLVPESEIEVHRIEDVPDGQPLAEDTGIQKVRLTAHDFDHCPECTGSFSFQKPIDGECPWCNAALPGITDGGGDD